MKQSYLIPDKTVEITYEVKKSRFITQVHFCGSRQEAMDLLAMVKKQYPDARHHCWAYLLGNPTQVDSAAFNDDGEPSGTAGKPILNVLNHSGIGNIMVIVNRYFGGIKLGAGGLVRAYSGATQQAVECLSVTEFVPTKTMSIKANFSDESSLRRYLMSLTIEIIEAQYHESVLLVIDCPEHKETQVIDYCAASPGLKVI